MPSKHAAQSALENNNTCKKPHTVHQPCFKSTCEHHLSDPLINSGENVDEEKICQAKLTELKKQAVVIEVIVLTLLTMVICRKTCTVITALHKKSFPGILMLVRLHLNQPIIGA